MWEKVRRAPEALPSAGGMAVEVCVLAVVASASMSLVLDLCLAILLGLLDMLVEPVIFRKCGENVAGIYQTFSVSAALKGGLADTYPDLACPSDQALLREAPPISSSSLVI